MKNHIKVREYSTYRLVFCLFLKLTKFMVYQWSLPNYFASKTKNLAALLFFFSSIQRKIPAGKCDGYRVRWKWSTWRLVEDGMSMGLTNTHTARGFSDLYHMFTRKQCILCPALCHGCLTLLYVTLTLDFFYPWNNRPNSSYKIYSMLSCCAL